jgi:hypothetical protein
MSINKWVKLWLEGQSWAGDSVPTNHSKPQPEFNNFITKLRYFTGEYFDNLDKRLLFF